MTVNLHLHRVVAQLTRRSLKPQSFLFLRYPRNLLGKRCLTIISRTGANSSMSRWTKTRWSSLPTLRPSLKPHREKNLLSLWMLLTVWQLKQRLIVRFHLEIKILTAQSLRILQTFSLRRSTGGRPISTWRRSNLQASRTLDSQSPRRRHSASKPVPRLPNRCSKRTMASSESQSKTAKVTSCELEPPRCLAFFRQCILHPQTECDWRVIFVLGNHKKTVWCFYYLIFILFIKD